MYLCISKTFYPFTSVVDYHRFEIYFIISAYYYKNEKRGLIINQNNRTKLNILFV